ncbi:RNA-binding protein [Paenibacillus albiflavus]|uniref:RNA-binding protein n=1 Tax=Paenibacillus albiflavus TaxID=2545760 RepID=A0A4R4E000_9BACL|nr:YlmH/Sll1252 family protein [Paenibacillus albiflavus]TCZ72304.1 RNA-binding protein [Paenibacillus albiflavus]
MNNDIYNHFHPDERHFVDRAADLVAQAAYGHAVKKTDFLDPRQAFILTTLVNREPDVQCRFDGGYAEAERKRAIIAPDYAYLDDEDIGIEVLSITSADSKFDSLAHGDFLGALLGLGMKRDKVGDIHVGDSTCHVLIASEAINYMHLQLSQVHRAHVQTEVLPLSMLQCVSPKLEESSFTVASLRLDGIVGDAFRLSRAKALIPIQAGRCRVNWKPELSPSKELKAGDVVSMQGFGRFKLLEVEGLTKKGRIRVTIGKYSS